MRKTITILLAAAALASLGAQPAAADDPQASVWTETGRWGWSHTQRCVTPDREGVVGQYGAWGAYHDGCTVKLRCNYSGGCSVGRGYGSISRSFEGVYWVEGDRTVWGDPYITYYEQTCNVRLRVFKRNGKIKTSRNGSGSSLGKDVCDAVADPSDADERSMRIRHGEIVTVQANGVRSTQPGWARVSAGVKLWENRMG
jgi:hypothetical protein